MKLEHRSYGTGGVCPQPQIQSRKSFLLLLVPWGDSSAASELLHMIRDAFLSTLHDPEHTRPFAVLDCLSHTANQLLTAVRLAHKHAYQNLNAEKYNIGFEVLAVAQNQQQWVVVSSGGAGVFAVPQKQSPANSKPCWLQPITYGQALNSASNDQSIYLPQNLLGLHSSCHLHVHNYSFQQGQQLLVTWHPQLPPGFLQLPSQHKAHTLDSWHQHLAQLQSQASFWLGMAHNQ